MVGLVQLGALAHGLQLDDVAREFDLGAPQVAALRGRTVGDRAQSARGPRACPVGGQPVRALRHAAAALGQLGDGDLRVAGRVERRDRPDRVRAERPEREVLRARQPLDRARRRR